MPSSHFGLCGGIKARDSSLINPPSQKTTGVSPWMNAGDGPAVALAEVGASADSAEEMKGTTGVSPWRLHFLPTETRALPANFIDSRNFF